MLKRLSGTFSQSSDQLLLPPSQASPSLNSYSAPSSPRSLRSVQPQSGSGYPFPSSPTTPTTSHPQTAGIPPTIDRSTLHKTLSLLSSLLVALDEMRAASILHSKAEKKVGKALKELGVGGWGEILRKKDSKEDSTIPDALLASTTMFENLAEVDSKLSKFVQNEYESLNEFTNKYFKKTAKEEKSYEDSLSSLDQKASRTTQSYARYASKHTSTSPALVSSSHLDSLTTSHSNYLSTLQSLQSQSQQLQLEYAEKIAARREATGREVARVVSGLAERSWRNRAEAVRKGGGEVIGRVLEKGVWVDKGFERVGEYEKRGRELAEEEEEETKEQESLNRAQNQSQAKEIENGVDSKRNVHIRGPRAPSTTSTQNTLTTTISSTLSSVPSSSSSPTPTTNRSELPQPPRSYSTSTIPSPIRQTSPLAEAPRIASPSLSSSTNTRRVSIAEEPIPIPSTPPESSSLGGGRTLPRGWYLDPSFANHLEEHSSPPSAPVSPPLSTSARSRPESVAGRPQFGGERRQTYDALSIQREGGGDEEVLLRKPTPRYGSAPPIGANQEQRDVGGVDEWGRNRVEGSGERESFVRGMSQKYGNGVSQEQTQTIASFQSSPPRPPPQNNHNRSNSRVSLLAKRYSSPPDHLPPSTPDVSETFSLHRPPQTPLPSTSRSSYSSQAQPQFTSASSSNQSHSTTSSEPHPPFCACQSCTTRHYSKNGKEELSRSEEERLQRELRMTAKGGTLKGLVGKGKEVFGRMG
ncbi:uncharacterized protein JCM6883_000215 [Sporobolomyces salmoneus]|uniref:uncharacterized protein n=1 Tax=Sporobolomyces salmoneus TaxID=183962 RepID=UPI00316D88A8